ncbi:MAG: bacterial transcriptional activator domain-containing protein, partial [Chloroflexota bacterium]
WIDSQIFEESVYRFNLQQLAGEDLKEPADQLSEALTLYKGKFLANYSRSDSVAFEKWLVSERQRLHSTAINSYHTLLSLRIEHREYEKGILDARRLLSLEPFDEMGHLCMMQFFVMNNELRKAQSTFERYETLLERDLGIAGLGDEIVSLYKQIGRKLHARSNKGDLLFPPSFESVDSSAELIKSRFTSSRGGHEQPDSYIEKSFLLQDLLIRKDQSIVTLISPIEGSLIPFFKMLENRFSSQLTDGIHLVSTKELDQKIVQNRLYDIQSSYYPIRNALLTQICHLLFPHENAKLSPNDMLEQIRAADALLIFPNYTSHKFVDQVIAELVAGQPSIKVIVGSAKKLQIDQEIVMDMDGSDPSRPALG